MPRPRKPRRLKFHVYRGPAGQLPTVPPGELLLEYFSDEEIVAWHAQGENIQRYHYLWWFELESQRALHQPAMIDALASIVGITIELRHWGRAIQYKYANFPLSCVGSLKWVGGRFNYGVDIDSSRFAPFPALYLAEDMETGIREMQGTVRNTPSNSQLFGHLLSLAGFEGAYNAKLNFFFYEIGMGFPARDRVSVSWGNGIIGNSAALYSSVFCCDTRHKRTRVAEPSVALETARLALVFAITEIRFLCCERGWVHFS